MIFLTTCLGFLICSIILEWLKLETKVIRSTLRVLRTNQQEIVSEAIMTRKYKYVYFINGIALLLEQTVNN